MWVQNRSRRPYYPGPRWGQLDIVEAIFAQQAAPPALSLQSAATHRPVRILCHRSQIHDPVSDDPGSECIGPTSWHVRAHTVKSHLSHHLQISLTWSHPSTSWTTVKACIEGLQKGGGWQDGRRWCPWWWSAWSCPRAAWWWGRGAPWTNIMRCRSVYQLLQWRIRFWNKEKLLQFSVDNLHQTSNKCHVKLVSRATTQQVTAETWSQAHWTNTILL